MTSDQHCHVDVIIVMLILLLCCHLHLDTLGLGLAAVGEVAAAEGVRVGGLGLVLAGVEQPLQLGLVPARHVVAVETLDNIYIQLIYISLLSAHIGSVREHVSAALVTQDP